MVVMVNSIEHSVVIKCPAERVYKALTTQEGIAGWWVNTNVMPEKVGEMAEFIFGSRYHNKMEITQLHPSRLVQWHCLKGDKEWIGTDITFSMEEKNEQTHVKFTHSNWCAATDFFAHCDQQWGKYMQSLKSYCETGKGEPYTD